MTNGDLISRSDLLNLVSDSAINRYGILFAIENAHSVDAVTVVRCNKCKHFTKMREIEGLSWTGFCNYGNFHTDEEDFCSRGERRTK